MRANPEMLAGLNKLWVRFFQLAVFATMFVRDHARPEFHKALGLDPTEYDMQVFRITTQISRQVFPVTLDIENPAFLRGLERMFRITEAMGAARRRGGFGGRVRRLGLGLAAAATFLRLYLLPARHAPLPDQVRLSPAW